jgi:Lipoxygenase
LLLWSTIGPPTSFSSPELFLQLTNSFATDRNFFDDDPLVTIDKLGLDSKDFTETTDWDLYPIVADLLEIWKASEKFAEQFVNLTYSSDQAIIDDTQLQNWMTQSGLPTEGNVRGLPAMGSRDALKRVLSSIIYRVAAHGNSRQLKSLGPALCFVPNYPPCLQDPRIPGPTETLSKEQILRYLPNTGTIGEMMTFYYIFTYSAPYTPLIPLYGSEEDLYFEPATDPRNAALIEFRESIEQFIRKYDEGAPLIHQWPVSIET